MRGRKGGLRQGPDVQRLQGDEPEGQWRPRRMLQTASRSSDARGRHAEEDVVRRCGRRSAAGPRSATNEPAREPRGDTVARIGPVVPGTQRAAFGSMPADGRAVPTGCGLPVLAPARENCTKPRCRCDIWTKVIGLQDRKSEQTNGWPDEVPARSGSHEKRRLRRSGAAVAEVMINPGCGSPRPGCRGASPCRPGCR